MFSDMSDNDFLDMMDGIASYRTGGKNQKNPGAAGPKKTSPGSAAQETAKAAAEAKTRAKDAENAKK